MSDGYGSAEDSRAPLYLPNRFLGGAANAAAAFVPTTPPTANNPSVAHGRIPDNGCLTVSTTLADTIKIFVYNEIAQDWYTPGSNTADNTKVFASAKGFDYFFGPLNARFYLQGGTASNTVCENGAPL